MVDVLQSITALIIEAGSEYTTLGQITPKRENRKKVRFPLAELGWRQYDIDRLLHTEV